MSAAHTIDPALVADDTPLRLEVAAQLAFPDGSIGPSSLRREAARGRLTIWRVANKDMTNLAEIRSMMKRCLVQPSQPDFGSDRSAESAPRPGSSSMEDGRSAQAAVEMRIKQLKQNSKRTLEQSTSTPRKANVIPMQPR